MAWRTDFVNAFFVPAQFGFGSTEPSPEEEDLLPPAKLSDVIADRGRFPSPPSKIDVRHPVWAGVIEDERDVRGAVVEMRDRLGFKYERVVALDDYVSQREAAGILQVPVMTINRWIRNHTLKGKKKKGYSVVKLRDLLQVAKAQKRKVRIGGTILTVR